MKLYFRQMFALLTASFLFSACGGGSSGSIVGSDIATPPSLPSITSIEVTTLNSTIAKGLDIVMVSTAIYDDGSSEIVTSNTVWTSQDTTIASVDTENIGTLHAIEEGTTIVTAQYSGYEASIEITVTAAELISITISPEIINLGIGENIQLTATGIYTDSERDITENVIWYSTDETIATVTSTGLLQTVAIGNGEIYASLDDIESTKKFVTVGDAVLTSIDITPETTEILESETATFTATGVMSDGMITPLSSVVWSSSDTSIATIDDGIATGLLPGSVTISANVDNISGEATLVVNDAVLESFTITSPSTLENKTSAALTAEGTYSDTSIKDISNLVAWTSSDPLIATISGSTITGVSEGTVTITGTINNMSETLSMNITPYSWWNHLSVVKGSQSSVIINGYVQAGSWAQFNLINASESSTLEVIRIWGKDGFGTTFMSQTLSDTLALHQGVGYTVTLQSNVYQPVISYDVKDTVTNVIKTFSASW